MLALPHVDRLRLGDGRGISVNELTRLRHLRACFRHLELLLDDAVRIAREQGRSWTEIGEILGISKQAAWERFEKRKRPRATNSIPGFAGDGIAVWPNESPLRASGSDPTLSPLVEAARLFIRLSDPGSSDEKRET